MNNSGCGDVVLVLLIAAPALAVPVVGGQWRWTFSSLACQSEKGDRRTGPDRIPAAGRLVRLIALKENVEVAGF